jgi:hypothetical protein
MMEERNARGNFSESRYLKNRGGDGRIALKWISGKWDYMLRE